MKASAPALILYSISGFLYFFSVVFDYEFLTVIAKPIIAASIFFYYWQESHGKINFWFSLILLMLFANGLLNLFEEESLFLYLLLTNFLAYAILFAFIVRNLLEFNLKTLCKTNLIYIFLMFLFLSSLLYMDLFLVFDSSFELYFFLVLYGSLLLALGLLSTLLYTLNHNKSNVYLIMTIFSFIICDLFYAVHYYYYHFALFRYISILCNIISFYFLVNYFLLRKENLLDIKNQ